MAASKTIRKAVTVGPTPPGLPPAPALDAFDETQWAVLMALVDAIIPSITPTSAVSDDKAQWGIADAELDRLAAETQKTVAEPPSPELFAAYLAERPASDPAFLGALRRTLASIPEGTLKQLGLVLTALSTRPGSLLLTGTTTLITEQTLRAREAVIQGWANSWFGTPRVLYKTFTTLAKAMWLQTSPVFRQATGFPDAPPGWKHITTGYEFVFEQFPPAASDSDAPVEIETDVVIVGSGCGGGVAAHALASAGHRVVVVDKGYHFPAWQLPMPQDQAGYHLYENQGLVASADGTVNTVAGSCWGGGGSINWSVSLQTQAFVRHEWAVEHGLPFFETGEFQACLDRVCEFMGVVEGEKVRQTHRGQVLLDGSKKLGFHAKPCPQNSGGAEHWCGHCHMGCGSGEKQGPAVSWLPAAGKKGAKFIEGFAVDEILWDDASSTEKQATGIRGSWKSRDSTGGVCGPAEDRTIRQVIIRAKKVIISAGTLNSPLILMRSGLTNPHIGQNLHIHPVNFIGAFYKEDAKPWEGPAITSVCTSFENLDGKGHGTKLEATCMLPYAFLTGVPWKSALDFKLTALRYRHMAGFISLARDRDTGRVFPDPITGRASIDYHVSPFDAAHVLEGVINLAKICYVTGATEIHSCLPGTRPFIRAASEDSTDDDGKEGGGFDSGVTDPAFTEWLATIRAAGNRNATFTSAHQMGTCRMSSHPGGGVVDPKGRVWGTRGLFVADASVFPSASGVNPMVTVMATADWISQAVAAELNEER